MINKTNINKVLKKLPKDKVELALDDYKKYQEDAFTVRKKIEEVVSEFVSKRKELLAIKTKASRLSVESSQIQKKAEDQANKDVKAAKELGVDASMFMKPYRVVVKDTDENLAIVERIIQALAKIK
tara:strand:- start:3086 stop:3463 length:378 start_codon:yes stop_codon:yes gene_type:complete